MMPFRQCRDGAFYEAALLYAQSLWLEGKPAQAILQLNKAWSADLRQDEGVLDKWPSPYAALCWMYVHVKEESFLGNPVRHFQHLATRMPATEPAIRVWRAWACFHLSERLLGENYPRDLDQIEKEELEIPAVNQVEQALDEYGWKHERAVFQKAYFIENC